MRRGVAVQHPEKYVLDDQELKRVSALARIELEDARVELERAHLAAQSMGKGAEGDEADDNVGGDDDEANWVESVLVVDLLCFFFVNLNGILFFKFFSVRMMKPWISTLVRFHSQRKTIYRNTI